MTDPATVPGTPGATEAVQRATNDSAWRGGRLVASYANRDLRPVEVVLLVRYRDRLTERVLELGCGAGRLTGYLAEIGRSVHGIDLSPEMVAFCRRRYPRATFDVGDLRDVAATGRASVDAVIAGFNVLDVLGDEARLAVLDAIHEVLAPGGLLILSSHNRAVAAKVAHPFALRGRSLVGLAELLIRYPAWRRNRHRLLPFERSEPGYAILNDSAHDFTLLHYYIDRDAQQRQLEEHGFDLLECLDLQGGSVAPGESAAESAELHYVALKREDPAR